jgi:pimeloyl-ACP methyl ester carboxylesterase
MMSVENSPDWFDRALQTEAEDTFVEVQNCKIHYVAWGKVGLPGVLLIHGSNAHLEWWRFVAPFLADQFRVVAVDLSGHGDSGWRTNYSGELFSQEIMAVCEAAQLGEKPFLVAHSFGGFVGLETGHRFGDQLGGIIFADFTVEPPERYVEWGRKAELRDGEPARSTRIYPAKEEALARFRFIPEQPCKHPYVVDFISHQSLRSVEGGVTWKFDPGLFDFLEMGVDQRDKFVSLKCRCAVLLGEYSTDEGALAAPYMREITAGILPIFTVPESYHHFMLDEPLATVTAIKGILLTWIYSDQQDEMNEGLQKQFGAL